MRTLAILFVLSILLAFGVAKGVAYWRTTGPDEEFLVKVPSPPKPEALQMPARASGGAVCPDTPLWELFDGELVALAMVSPGGREAFVVGTMPGTRPAGPEPMPQLTVVDSGGSSIAREFVRETVPGVGNKLDAIALRVPLAGPANDRLVFLTSACVPNRAARGRWWSYRDPEPVPPEDQRLILDEVQATLRTGTWLTPGNTLAVPASMEPTRLGVLPARIVGCKLLVVFNHQQSNLLLKSHYYSALLCLDGEGKLTRAPVPPIEGRVITQVGVIDLDGDNRDEIIVTHRKFDDAGLHGEIEELLLHEYGTGELHVRVLRRS